MPWLSTCSLTTLKAVGVIVFGYSSRSKDDSARVEITEINTVGVSMKGVGKVVVNAIASDLMIIIPFRNLRTLPPPVSCKSVQHIQYFCVRHITLLLATCVAPPCWFCLIFYCHFHAPIAIQYNAELPPSLVFPPAAYLNPVVVKLPS